MASDTSSGHASDIEGVDLAALAAWMDSAGLGSGPITDTELLVGGTQNILLRFTRDGRDYVLRRPPVHKRANSDETMRREMRVLGALAGSDVPHPGLIAACPTEDVLGAAFYLMEPVAGVNPSEDLPERYRTDPEWREGLGFSMVDGIAALSRVDHVARGLADFGRSENWIARQVGRWRKQLDSYADVPKYPGPSLPHVEEVSAWLTEHQPTECRLGLVHGDAHIANVLVSRDEPRVAAFVDWELATIGDVRLDLGHMIATWPGRPGTVAKVEIPGLPEPDALVARYAESAGREVHDIEWFVVLACYRLGIILEGSWARMLAGQTTAEVGERLGAMGRALFEQAHEITG
ncbi:phosphotransferase family protein [Sporichthya polymorpha]|uniref:phosphotransferase family protein n=1 Tax=Sporichthya polymorpha TaxID=35751 RepID=UPI00037B2D43|nr:phosphotransferase family protein [Sporichthya polymorpha]